MKSIIKFISILIIVIVLIFVSYKVYLGYSYWIALKTKNNQWMENEFKPKEIVGFISEIDRNENQKFFITLRIKTNSETLSYGLCIDKNQEFINFITEGDSVVKKPNELFLTFIKKNNVKRNFYLPFCD